MGSMLGVVITLVAVGISAGSLFLFWKVFAGIQQKQAAVQQLLATGIPGTARILGLEATGTSVAVMGKRSIGVNLVLEVNVPGRAPYQAQVNQLINELLVASVQPGATVAVRVDPQNPNIIAVAPGAPVGPMPVQGAWGAPAGGMKIGNAAWNQPGAPAPLMGAQAGYGPPGGPPPGAGYGAPPGAGYGAPPAAAGWGAPPVMGAGMPGMGMPGMGMPGMGMPNMGMPGMHAAGFGSADIGKAMKRSMKLAIVIMLVTTVPIVAIMLAVFVDWSAFGIGGDDESPTSRGGDVPGGGDASPGGAIPKGGYCEATVRCCKVVFPNAATNNCDNWKNLPASGCKTTWESYSQSAKSQGKTCK